MGHILENVVYLELLRRYDDVYVGKVGRTEIDFVAVRDGQPEYYQVAYTVVGADGAILQRELAPLQDVKDFYPRYLLTMDLMPPVSHEGIKQLYVLDWLLQKKN